tara:strand:- start:1024 stop:1506 length:483 start_codon:yes stop_codon:yes gene_type:complete
MAYQKLQVGKGLAVILSDTVKIPDPSTQVLSGTANFSVASTLTDVGTTFLTAGIQENAIVYNTTAGIAYYVTAITDDLNLALSPATTGGASDDYVIYNAPSNGNVLYVGGAGIVSVIMAGDKDSGVTTDFAGVPAGAFLPIQAVQVATTTTTATDIVALW